MISDADENMYNRCNLSDFLQLVEALKFWLPDEIFISPGEKFEHLSEDWKKHVALLQRVEAGRHG